MLQNNYNYWQLYFVTPLRLERNERELKTFCFALQKLSNHFDQKDSVFVGLALKGALASLEANFGY